MLSNKLTSQASSTIRGPAGFSVAYFLRLAMLWALTLVYLFLNERSTGWRFDFVVATIVIFTINHFLYQKLTSPMKLLLVSIIDFIAAGAYAFVFIQDSFPHMLFVGLVGISLFLSLDAKMVWKPWAATLVTYWIIVNISTLVYRHHVDLVNVVSTYAFVGFGSFVGRSFRSSYLAGLETSRLNEVLEESHAQLREYAEKAEEMAATRERIRIAREIHDTVGHLLTALLVQLQAAKKLQASDLMKSAESIDHCEQLVRNALQEVRLSVRAIREEDTSPLSLVESLEQLTTDFARATGIRTSIFENTTLPPLPSNLRLSIYRYVQEALTNAQRHGGASEVRIEIGYSEDKLMIMIVDNGTGAEVVSEGFGLMNMRERIAEHQGSITIQTAPGRGFELKAELPLKEKST